MSVQELSSLHGRYVELSGRFRAAWAFHQFVQSIQKIFLDGAATELAGQFQDVYSRLKGLSQKLNASEAGHVREDLEQVGEELLGLTVRLVEEDSRIPPHYLRQFFQRVKSYDEKILTQLVKFYLFDLPENGWPGDRVDKLDYLLSRLGEEKADGGDELVLKERRHLHEVFKGLWKVVAVAEPSPEKVAGHTEAVDDLRRVAAEVTSLDELNDRHLVRDYRELKHSLGTLFIHPRVCLAIVETNLYLRDKIHELYRKEERRIITDYQQIFELEREVHIDTGLDEELSQFRREVEDFEKLLQDDEIRLNDLAQIRDRVRSLLPRLADAQRGEGGSQDLSAVDHAESYLPPPAVPAPEPPAGAAPVFAAELERLTHALEGTSSTASAKSVALSPELYPFRLEPREVTAYRRGKDAEGDTELERFLLEAASLRARVNDQVESIRGILDDTAVTGNAPVFAEARTTLKAADALLWRFSHMIDHEVLAGEVEEAQSLLVLRMRLMRDYAGLWLLAYKPFLPTKRS